MERGNLPLAEAAARQLGQLTLEDALSLLALMADKAPERYERAALRWLRRFQDERSPRLSAVALATVALLELPLDQGMAGRRRWLGCFAGLVRP
jgi:2-polyprenyl-6-methoxyphenol hydroxylase-like FAD-dependent oxidoreductase